MIILSTRLGLACVVLAAAAACAQSPPSSAPNVPAAPPSAAAGPQPSASVGISAQNPKQPTSKDLRLAAKLYLSAATHYQNQQFELALAEYNQAAALDPGNIDYAQAAQVARSHAVTALIQDAAHARTRGDNAAARSSLEHALALDPLNTIVSEHLHSLADETAADETVIAQPGLDGAHAAPQLGPPVAIIPTTAPHSFHIHTGERQIIQQVFKAYGIEANIDDSVHSTVLHFDLDDASFADAARVVSMVTNSFYVPIDTHRVIVARDTRDMRQQYMRNELETVYLYGMSAEEMTAMGNIAKNVFEMQQTALDPTSGTLTLRAPETTLTAFNTTYHDLMEGRPQVLIDVRIIQLAQNSTVNTGVQPTQTITAFNVYAEEQSILSQNQALVQQIISSGLASPGDTLQILAILLASGQVTSSLFSQGIALFGGGLTLSGVSPGPATLNLNLNSSDSRELDDYQLRLQDGEEGTLKSGTRYPIMTSSFSGLSASNLNIPGLTGAGTSSSLSALASSLTGAATNIPQFQYQDLGLVLKATPRVLRSGDVALTLDMKISSLAGSSINAVPVLANRSYSGVATLRANEAIVIASEVDKSETRAISGIPGLSEIPGMNNITEKDIQKSYASLLIILTPHVLLSPHGLGHSPMMRVDRSTQAR